MLRLFIWYRLFFMSFAISVPYFFVGFALYGVKGAGVGLVLAVGTLLFGALYAEYGVRRASKAELRSPQGMVRSVELAISHLGGIPPRILIYADPFPNVLVAKSLGSRGTVFLSQGLIALLNDLELQNVL